MDYGLLSRFRTQLMGAAMVWVMLFHAPDLAPPGSLPDLFRAAGFGGVDIFILLSAMGLSLSLGRREQDYAAFLARRGERLLPAYFVVMVPYTLCLILAKGATWSSLFWNASLLYYWVRPSGAFNWYVAGAMALYIITPFCFARLRAARHREGLTAAACAAALALCQLFTHEGYWHVTDLFFRVPVFFLGLLLGFYVGEGRRLTRRDYAFWAAALVVGAAYLYVSLTAIWEPWPVHFPECHLFLCTTVPMCLGLALCLERLPLGWLSALLERIGQNSLEIYLLNVSLFVPFQALPQGWPLPAPVYYLLSILANIALGCLLHRLVEGGKAAWHARRTPAAARG